MYLKKGGRITPAAAALGTLLKLKPVLQIQEREAGCICQGENCQAGKEPDDRGDEARFAGAVP